MVTADELIGLARRLAVGPDEAHWRAAVSRAYYAAFHHLRPLAEERVGLPSFGTSEDHRELSQALRQIDVEVANTFVLLRAERNVADYDIERSFGQTRARAVCDLASELLASG